MATFKGIIFDIDGTLVDNMMVHHRAWQQHLRELGLDYSLERVKEEIHGVNLEILERLFGDKYTVEERKQLAWDKEKAYRDIFADEFEANIVPGVRDFIARTQGQGIPLAVATAGPEENCNFALQHLGIRDAMTHVVHSGMVSRGKPDPEAFEQAAAGLGLDLKDCLVFEDSVTGAKAANNGSAPVVVITTTHTEPEFNELEVVSFQPDFTALSCVPSADGFLLQIL